MKYIAVSTIILSALLPGTGVHQLHAQQAEEIFTWPGSVEVSTSTLMIREGETVSYMVRLTEQPVVNDWWLFVQVDGVVYHDGAFCKDTIDTKVVTIPCDLGEAFTDPNCKDGMGPAMTCPWIRWTPSVGWDIDRVAGSPDPIQGSPNPTEWRTVSITAPHDADADDEFLTFTHEVWDETTACPDDLHAVAPVTVHIIDDDTPATGVTLSVSEDEVGEGAGATTLTVTGTLNGGAFTEDTTVELSVSAGTATETDDYTYTAGTETLTIQGGMTSGTADLTLTPVDDDVDEDDETVTVGGTATNLTVKGTTVTIIDDDERGVGVTPTTLSFNEGGSGDYEVVLESEPAAAVTVEISVTGDEDVTVQPTRVTFTAANWSMARTVVVSGAQDDDEADDEATVGHTVSGGDYGDNGVTAEDVQVTVSDDDTPATGVTLSVSEDEVGEGAGATTLTVTGTLNGGAFTEDTTVELSVSAGTATETDDYTYTAGTETLTIQGGMTSGTADLTLTPVDDDVDEDDETVTVGGTATNLTVKGTTVTIIDDDERGVGVTPTTLSFNEGGSGDYEVVLESEPAAAVTVEISVTGDEDVTVQPTRVTFTAANWSMARTVVVSGAQDDDDDDEARTTKTTTRRTTRRRWAVGHTVSGGDGTATTV